MASAKFLEEALSTDVDESAVNAIVGSLETQLVSASPVVTCTPASAPTGASNHVNSVANGSRPPTSVSSLKHVGASVANGSPGQMNIVINQEKAQEVIGTAVHNVGTASSSAGFQVTSSSISSLTSSVVQTNISNVNKDSVKVVYPSSQPVASVVRNVSYAGGLPNGTVSTATMANCEVQTSTMAFPVTSTAKTASVQSGVDKPTGTALVIKSGVGSSQNAPTTMSVATGVATATASVGVGGAVSNSGTGVQAPGVVSFTKPLTQAVGTQQTAIVGGSPLSNVQILNVNALRAGTPIQTGAKGIPRGAVMINAGQMVGGRQVQPGQITLQTLQGLAPGAQGHLLLKTENGQYQLLRVGPPAAPGGTQQATPVSAIAGNNVSTFRVQTIQMFATSLVVWYLSKVVVVFAMMMSILAIFYFACIEKGGILNNMNALSDESKNKILLVFVYLMGSYALMYLSVVLASQCFLIQKLSTTFPKHLVVGSILSVKIVGSVLERVPDLPEYSAVRNASWVLLAVVMGPCFALFGNEICLQGGIYTALCAALANSLGLTANDEFYNFIKIKLAISYALVCLSTMLCLFLTPPLRLVGSLFVTLNIFGGILLYFGMYVALVQDAAKTAKFNDVDPLQSSAAIFMCSVNLYLRLGLMQVVENARMLHTATPNATNTGTPVQTQVPALAAQGTATVQPQRGAVDQTKEKCRKFLANLLELSSREPKAVERSVRTLIQELVDTKVEPEQFCDRLEKLLNASPQPCLIGFLKKSLPLLRQSMVNNELVIDGIKPPPASVVFSTAPIAATTQTPQVVAAAPSVVRPPIQMQTTPQMRVVTPTSVRPGQQIQQRIITPMRTATASTQVASVGVNKSAVTAIRTQGTTTIVRPTTQIVRTPTGNIALRPGQTLTKTQFSTRPVLAATTQFSTPTKPSSVFVSKTPTTASSIKDPRDKKTFSSASSGAGYMGDDDINDVAAMGGVNLAEESQRILGSTEFVGTQIRSCKDDIFLHSAPLMNKIAVIAHKHGLDEPNSDVATLISHATQERLKDLVEKLAVIAEHRMDFNKADPRYEVTHDVRAQLKCLEEVDKAERKRHEEHERELLLRAAKSRTKPEDPEQAKLKAKAKEMQRAEMEELRQREANLTALLAIGPRKKPKIDESAGSPSTAGASTSTPPIAMRPRVKRVCMRDLQMMMEQEKETCRSLLLYKSYFK